MSSIRKLTITCVAALAVTSGTVSAAAHTGQPIKVRVIKQVYPDLYQRELHRQPVSWNHLRDLAHSRWDRTHPAAARAALLKSYLSNPTPANNRSLARLYLNNEADFACMDQIVGSESSWYHTVWNHQGSGAYGIPQALPGSKMATAGADWLTNPLTQIRWMKSYAVGRYGSLCAARDHRFSQGYY